MTGLVTWLVDHDALVVGCLVGLMAFLMVLPGLVVRLGDTEDGAR